MSNTIQIIIETRSAEQKEILIAELSDINFDAFEENKNSLSAFIKEENFNEDELNKILSHKKLSFKKILIQETNWNAKWESGFEPINIENFVAVRASFHEPIKNVEHEIIITPKMSFGTGHHATTYIMLQQMQHLNFFNKTVLDFGTGTGILAIMAKKLGAQKVVAIDNDEWSINNAKENFAANNCTDIELQLKDNLLRIGKFDIILANINLNVITQNIPGFIDISHQPSKLLLSGFLSHDKNILIKSFVAKGFRCEKIAERNDWVSVLLIKL